MEHATQRRVRNQDGGLEDQLGRGTKHVVGPECASSALRLDHSCVGREREKVDTNHRRMKSAGAGTNAAQQSEAGAVVARGFRRSDVGGSNGPTGEEELYYYSAVSRISRTRGPRGNTRWKGEGISFCCLPSFSHRSREWGSNNPGECRSSPRLAADQPRDRSLSMCTRTSLHPCFSK